MQNITCQFCNTVNRVGDSVPVGARPICGSCKRHLFNYSPAKKTGVVTTQKTETVTPESKKSGLLQPRYIILFLSIVVWFYQGCQMNDINQQATPYVTQLQRMDPSGQLGWASLESLGHVCLGDDLGALDTLIGGLEADSSTKTQLRQQLEPLRVEYESAHSWSSWAFWIGFFTLSWIGIKYWKGRQGTSQ